ncbi:RNA polymerase sigma factor [Syntrophomonas palmitatica]|uniref:RNA polymerase sigma factor n=1 Tax=Syntrophomonas palmitatica TaxID=402877 RepID=UPI0006D1E9D8|nr:sigma-70 family RNA polymerase sigma factor [Syntrophomonas palmitatica]
MTSDESLAVQALEGDLAAFEELVDRYKNRIFSVVYRMVGQYQEAEDITQEVFIHLYQKLYQFDRDKKFSPWVYRIACNTSITELRKKKRIVWLELDDVHSTAYDNQNIAADYDLITL